MYLERAVQALRNRGYPVDDTLLRHLSPLGWEHINLTADYVSPLSVRYFPDPQLAAMQMALGDALSTLGESGTVRLEEAIAAYRAALEEMTRARVPLDWAMPGTISAVRSGSSGSARRMERRR